MIGAKRPDRRSAKLLTIDADGGMRQLPRAALASLFSPGDLVIANDAATLPASLKGIHCTSGEPIEVRLAGWVSIRDPTGFAAIAFGAGDHRTRTEDRILPPSLSPGDRLTLGPLVAIVERHSTISACSNCASWAIAQPSSPGLRDTDGPSNTRTSPNRWPYGTSGRELPPTRSHSSHPQPDLRSTGTPGQSGGSGASALLH
jgi:hypothetical protein